jgi:hypothetical protein
VVNSEPSYSLTGIDKPQLRTSLYEIRFSAPKWQLLPCAEHNGAALPIRLALWRLPERLYRDIIDVASAAVKARHRGPSPGSPPNHYPRHEPQLDHPEGARHAPWQWFQEGDG